MTLHNTYRSILVLSLCTLLPVPSFGQYFYPLEVGNEWFYRNIYLAPNDSTISSSIRVIGDSLFSNGHRYFVLSDNDIMGSRYLRTDSTSIFYINPYTIQEERVFKLNSELGDTVQVSWGPFATVRVSAIDTLTVLGIRQRVLSFELEGSLYAVLRLCENFGPLGESRYGDPPPPWPDWGRELVGCTINNRSYGITLAVPEQTPSPQFFALYQNFPNPFNPVTHISYTLWSQSMVLLRIFDIQGREVRTLIHQDEPSGIRSVTWDGHDSQGRPVSSGVYIYELRTAKISQARRMLLLR